MGNDSYSWGYKNAASLSKEMAGGGRVAVKPHTRMPRTQMPRIAPVMPMPMAAAPSMAPPSMGPPGMKKGGSVKKYAKGGKVTPAKSPMKATPPEKDTPEQIKGLKGNVVKKAKGGCVKGMAKGGKWIAGAIKRPGALHAELGVPKGEKIPAKKLAAAAKKPGVEGKRARLAQTLKSFKK